MHTCQKGYERSTAVGQVCWVEYEQRPSMDRMQPKELKTARPCAVCAEPNNTMDWGERRSRCCQGRGHAEGGDAGPLTMMVRVFCWWAIRRDPSCAPPLPPFCRRWLW